MSAEHPLPVEPVRELTETEAAEQLSRARAAGEGVWSADLSRAQGKQGVLSAIASGLALPAHFGGNWDALYDCLTDLRPAQASAGMAAGAMRIHLSQVPRPPRLAAPDRDQLMGVLSDVAEFHAGQGRRCLISWSPGAA